MPAHLNLYDWGQSVLKIFLTFFIQVAAGRQDYFHFAGSNRLDFSFPTRGGSEIQATRLAKTLGEGPCVLFIHGFSAKKEYMHYLMRPHYERGHQVFTVNMPGHGMNHNKSSVAPGMGSFTHLITDFCDAAINQVSRQCGGVPISVITHSMGGMSCSNYLKGVDEKNGRTIVDPLERQKRNRKIKAAVFIAPPESFHIDHFEWPMIALMEKLPIEKNQAKLVNIPLSVMEELGAVTGPNTRAGRIIDAFLREMPLINLSSSGIVTLGDLEKGEAVELLNLIGTVHPELVASMKSKSDVYSKESIDRENGKMITWRKNEEGEFVLTESELPRDLQEEEFQNPYVKIISSYRTDDGGVILEGLQNNEHTDIIYIGGGKDRLAHWKQVERQAMNSQGDTYIHMVDFDHANTSFGARARDLLTPFTIEVAERGLSPEAVNYVLERQAEGSMWIKSKDPRYPELKKDPEIVKDINRKLEIVERLKHYTCTSGTKLFFGPLKQRN